MRRDTHTMIPSFPAGGRYQQETVDTVSGVNRGTVYKGKDRVLGDHKVLRVFPTRWATAIRAGEQFQEPEFRKNLAIGWEPGDKPALTHCLLQSLNPTGSQEEVQRSQPLGHRSGEGVKGGERICRQKDIEHISLVQVVVFFVLLNALHTTEYIFKIHLS